MPWAQKELLVILVKLISEYEDKTSDLPEVDPVELIKIRMEEFGYNSKELAPWLNQQMENELHKLIIDNWKESAR